MSDFERKLRDLHKDACAKTLRYWTAYAKGDRNAAGAYELWSSVRAHLEAAGSAYGITLEH